MSTAATAKQQIQQARAETKPKEEPTNPEFQALLNKAVGRTATFKPLGETEPITLSVAIVREHFAPKTASGKSPSDSQLMKFIMLCRAQLLNPWEGECLINGYDTKDGPQFSLITTQQALRKRAERNQYFDGTESGVMVVTTAGELIERNGEIVLPKETLVGAWAKVYRKDKRFPFYRTINLASYDQRRARWNTDKPGMIRKCAESGALRQAFPLECSGLYVEGEAVELEAAGYVERPNTPQQVGQMEPVADESEAAATAIADEAAVNQTVPGDDSGADIVAIAEKVFGRCGTLDELANRAHEYEQHQLTPEQVKRLTAAYGARKAQLTK